MTGPIITTFVNPPVPVRSFDWIAYRDGAEEAGPYGSGATELDALRDLADQCDVCGGYGTHTVHAQGFNTDFGPDFHEEPCGECYDIYGAIAKAEGRAAELPEANASERSAP